LIAADNRFIVAQNAGYYYDEKAFFSTSLEMIFTEASYWFPVIWLLYNNNRNIKAKMIVSTYDLFLPALFIFSVVP